MNPKRQPPPPTAAERIAATLREGRTRGGHAQGTVAALLTALGKPTKTSTITRIESGAQAITVEEALLASLLLPGGLRGLLAVPFTIGGITIRDEASLDVLLTGDHWDDVKPDVRIHTRLDADTAPVIGKTYRDLRDAQIAETIGTTTRKVSAAALELYGHSADDEIRIRMHARLDELDPRPTSETAAWRAHRGHAIRQITKEIEEHL